MAFKGVVTGNLGGDPELRHTQAGKPILNLSIGSTLAKKDRDTGQWSDVGEPLWIRCAFFDAEAERLAQSLAKGDRVSVEGTLTRKVFQTRDGGTGESLELDWPRFLGVIPKQRDGGSAYGQPAQASYTQPADDPWGGPAAAGYDTTPPF